MSLRTDRVLSHAFRCGLHRRGAKSRTEEDESTWAFDAFAAHAENRKVTERLREAHAAGWVEPVPEDELWPEANAKEQGLVFYRLTEFGKTVLRGAK